jgi:FMN phosphatase YigB (HAD superfamily)
LRVDAVIFDLWETLVDWDPVAADEMLLAIARRAEVDHDDFRERWNGKGNGRYTGPIRAALLEAGLREDVLDDVCALRLDYNRRALVPRPGAVETLHELRRRGKRLGMISVCSEEV